MPVRIARPLTLSRLREMGVIHEPIRTPSSFDPDGSYTAVYRVWATQGFEGRDHQQGFIRLRRIQRSLSSFELEIRQVMRDGNKQLHSVDARMVCSRELPSSPIGWTLASEFVREDAGRLDDLCQIETGCVNSGVLEIRRGDHTHRLIVEANLASDWGLLETVQRLPFGSEADISFAMLEGLSLLKERHRLSYAGCVSEVSPHGEFTLHCFQHTGRGIVPCEYWLDEEHRLLAVIGGGRAYIMEPLMVAPLPGLLAAHLGDEHRQ